MNELGPSCASDFIDCLTEAVATEFRSTDRCRLRWYYAELGRSDCLPGRTLRFKIYRQVFRCRGPHLPSLKTATRQRALSCHMTARRRRAPPHACVLRRGCEALRGEAPPPAPRWGPVRAEAPSLPPPSLSRGSRYPAGRRREPCRSGSGAATCALTAAGRVSPSGRALSPPLP